MVLVYNKTGGMRDEKITSPWHAIGAGHLQVRKKGDMKRGKVYQKGLEMEFDHFFRTILRSKRIDSAPIWRVSEQGWFFKGKKEEGLDNSFKFVILFNILGEGGYITARSAA